MMRSAIGLTLYNSFVRSANVAGLLSRRDWRSLGLFRVRTTGENGEGAVDLFGKHHACKFVRVGHLAQREFRVLPIEQNGRKTIGVTANEDEFAGAAVALIANPFCKGFRREALAVGV